MYSEKVEYDRIPYDIVGFGGVSRGWVGTSSRVG